MNYALEAIAARIKYLPVMTRLAYANTLIWLSHRLHPTVPPMNTYLGKLALNQLSKADKKLRPSWELLEERVKYNLPPIR